jgi:cell wall-associated NlpC family hydrolase
MIAKSFLLLVVLLSRPIAPESCLSRATSIRTVALQYLGARYRYGADSSTAVDCASYVRRVFRAIGSELPRTVLEQFQAGRAITFDELRVGDLLFYRDTYRRGVSHVGIYIGEGKFVHAAGRARGVVVASIRSEYFRKRFAGARRILDDVAESTVFVSSR